MSFLNLKTWLTLYITSSLALLYITIASTYMHNASDNVGMFVVPLLGGLLVLAALFLIDLKNIVERFSFQWSDLLLLSAMLSSVLYAVLGVFSTLIFIIIYLIPYGLLEFIGLEYSSITLILSLLFLLQVGVQLYSLFKKITPEELLKPIPSHSFSIEFFALKKLFATALILALLATILLYKPSRNFGQDFDFISFYLGLAIQSSVFIYLASIFALLSRFLYQKYKKVEHQITWVTLLSHTAARVSYMGIPVVILMLYTLVMNAMSGL